MLTGFQTLLNQGENFLEQADPGTVQLAALPGVDLAANVGDFKFERTLRGTAFAVVEMGTVILRRAVLMAAGITTDPQIDDKLLVRDNLYRIERVTPDASSFRLDCVSSAN